MKQYAGEDIVRIMTEMPADLVTQLREAHPDHHITEHEARWWGFLQFARTDASEGDTFVIKVGGTNEEVVQSFLPYVLVGRNADRNAGLVRKTWPDMG